MAIAIYFHPPALSEQQYRAVVAQLEQGGAWPPAGMVHHSCFGEGESLMVYEVWQDKESADAFGREHLMPALQQNQIDPGQPQVMPVVNLLP